jgi:hypothetical protein
MPAGLFSRHADVADDAANATAGRKHPETLGPYSVEFVEEPTVVGNRPHLPIVLGIFLQRPIGRRRNDKMDRFVRQPRQIARVALVQTMRGCVERRGPGLPSEGFVSLAKGRKAFRRRVVSVGGGDPIHWTSFSIRGICVKRVRRVSLAESKSAALLVLRAPLPRPVEQTGTDVRKLVRAAFGLRPKLRAT